MRACQRCTRLCMGVCVCARVRDVLDCVWEFVCVCVRVLVQHAFLQTIEVVNC